MISLLLQLFALLTIALSDPAPSAPAAVAPPPLSAPHGVSAPMQTSDVGARVTQSTRVEVKADTIEWIDPIARLQRELDNGSRTLVYDSLLGYLPSLLQALEIPVSSQGLVFSRTSLQTDRIAPWAPRALYFNDDVYIGYVLGSTFLEVAAVHPTKGSVFYTLAQAEQPRKAFEPEGRTCLMCHQSRSTTGGVPGLMVLSTLSDRYGYPIAGVQEGPMTDATPINKRFGGWYVTGTHGAEASDSTIGSGHAGNVYSPQLSHEIVDRRRYLSEFALTRESSLTDLSSLLDTTRYLSKHSDIVALSVLVHQTVVHNLITTLHEAAGRLPTDATDEQLDRAGHPDVVRLEAAARRLADAMLFANAAPLAGPMRGTTAFSAEFAALGPKDKQGRSLRDFDLTERLFRYPLSFLIYSEAFRALPDAARQLVYVRIAAVLDGSVPAVTKSARLTSDSRRAIGEILRGTLPEYARLSAKK